jgi:DNA-binding SARP family transcriptional activator/TolB-like protein
MTVTNVKRRDAPTNRAVAQQEKRVPLKISVFGRFQVTYGGQEVRIKSRKSRAVLAYIALNDARVETRERLVGLFWSDSDEQHARASLRQTLRELRLSFLQIGYQGLQAEKLTIELDRDSLELDFWAVMHEVEAQRAHPLLLETPRLADRLLDDIGDVDPEFHSWVLAKRQTIHDRLVRALEDALLGRSVGRNARRQLAEALVSLDPTHEEACRTLMRVRAEEGDISAALRIYKALWDLLGDEYDMEPSLKTQQLVAEIKQGEIEIRSGPIGLIPSEPHANLLPLASQPPQLPPIEPSHRSAGKITLLLSSFEINGVAPDKTHLVHGFRHHLTACLVRFREWSIIDQVSSAPDAPGVPDIQPQYCIDATSYQVGGVANMILTLRDNGSNRYVWSETFELSLENWFEAQQRIVRRIAISLNVQLSTERLMRLAGEPDVSLEIYDRWLRAQSGILNFKPDNWSGAAKLLADTIRDAPNFSPAYSSLVQLNNTVHFVYPGVFRDPTKAKEALELARTAVQLDPVDSRAQLCLGWAYAMSHQFEQAEVHMDLARELNENDSWTLTSAALFAGFCGALNKAHKLGQEALDATLAPTPLQWAYLAMIRFMCGDYVDAIEATDRANDAIRTMPAWRAAALLHLGRNAEASAEALRFLAIVRGVWFGAGAPADEVVARWFLHCHPIRSSERWERLRDGIRGAGVSVVGCKHLAW